MKIGRWGTSDCLCDCELKGKGRVRSCGCTTLRVTALQKFFFFIYSIFFIWTGLVWLGFNITKPKLNQTGSVSKYSNWFDQFFFLVQFFRLIFFQFYRFNQYTGFFAHLLILRMISNFALFSPIINYNYNYKLTKRLFLNVWLFI